MTRRLVTFYDAIRTDSSLRRAPWWRAAWWQLRDRAAHYLVCSWRGCRFDTYVFDSYSLYFCTCCRCEATGRTFADLEPTPADHDFPWWEADR